MTGPAGQTAAAPDQQVGAAGGVKELDLFPRDLWHGGKVRLLPHTLACFLVPGQRDSNSEGGTFVGCPPVSAPGLDQAERFVLVPSGDRELVCPCSCEATTVVTYAEEAKTDRGNSRTAVVDRELGFDGSGFLIEGVQPARKPDHLTLGNLLPPALLYMPLPPPVEVVGYPDIEQATVRVEEPVGTGHLFGVASTPSLGRHGLRLVVGGRGGIGHWDPSGFAHLDQPLVGNEASARLALLGNHGQVLQVERGVHSVPEDRPKINYAHVGHALHDTKVTGLHDVHNVTWTGKVRQLTSKTSTAWQLTQGAGKSNAFNTRLTGALMSRRVSAAQLELSSKPHALYRFYDRTDVLLYVGITMDLPTRFKNHRNKKPWWTQVHQIGVEQFATRQEALAAEAEAIRAEKPLYNDQHNELVNLEDPLPKLSEIDGQWLLENWPKIPPTIRDYIEVPAWRDGWYGLADTLLESFTPMEIKRYVELGKAQGERDGEDDLDGPESKVRAIEAAVKDLQLTVALLSLSIDNLMDFLPLEQVNRVLGQAHDDLDTAETARTGLSDGLVLAHAMNHLVHEAASAHLNGLDEPAREACLRRAKEAYPDIDERQLVLVAAQHSRHQQAFGAPLLDEIKELGA